MAHSSRGWFAEHWVDLLTAVLTVIGLWVAWRIPVSLNDQDRGERIKSDRQAKLESDVGQINHLISGNLGEEGTEHIAAKRAAARAAQEYAQQGRVYLPSTSVLFHYLEKEPDAKTHCYLRGAIEAGLKVRPPTLGTGSPQEADGDSAEEHKKKEEDWKKQVADEAAILKSLELPTDKGDCSAIAEAAHVPPQTPKSSEFRQYLDVNCGQVNVNPGLNVTIDSVLSSQFKVVKVLPTIEDSSNLKDSHAQLVDMRPDGGIVSYSITGLDRQLFGNCPGGGHGTLVVRFELAPK